MRSFLRLLVSDFRTWRAGKQQTTTRPGNCPSSGSSHSNVGSGVDPKEGNPMRRRPSSQRTTAAAAAVRSRSLVSAIARSRSERELVCARGCDWRTEGGEKKRKKNLRKHLGTKS